MTTGLDVVQDLADILVDARRNRRPMKSATLDNESVSIENANAVQARVAETLGWFDTAMPQYWKSGGPAKDKPILHAPLPPEGVFTSPADASQVLLFAPGIEAEIALRLGKDITPDAVNGMAQSDIADLIDGMAVSIEIVDSRWAEGAEAPTLLRLADQQSHGALVLGEWQRYQRRDWSAQTCRIRIGTQVDIVKQGTHAYGDPAWGLLEWLRHATRNGATVPAGTVVTTGTWCGVLPVEKGERVLVMFEGLGEAEVVV